MPDRRPEFVTDEHLAAVNHLTTSQLGQFFSWLMLTYAQRHGLNQEDIDAHKAAMLKARPDRLEAERFRITKLRDIKQAELNDYNDDLKRLDKLASIEGV